MQEALWALRDVVGRKDVHDKMRVGLKSRSETSEPFDLKAFLQTASTQECVDLAIWCTTERAGRKAQVQGMMKAVSSHSPAFTSVLKPKIIEEIFVLGCVWSLAIYV